MGCGRMSPALLLLLSLASCSLLQGKPVLKLSPQSGVGGGCKAGGSTGTPLRPTEGTSEEEGPKWPSRCDEKENPRVSSSCVRVLSAVSALAEAWRVFSVCHGLGGRRG